MRKTTDQDNRRDREMLKRQAGTFSREGQVFPIQVMFLRFLVLSLQVTPILLLPLAGWGWRDWRGFLSHPACTALLAVVVLAMAAVVFLRLDLQPLRKGNSPTGSQTVVLLTLAGASLFLIWFLPLADRRQILTFTRNRFWPDLGLGLCCSGIGVRLLALMKLGRQFSAYVTLQDEHQLVQSGIYRRIRHPLYLSLLLAAPGFALIFSSLLVWPILTVTAIFVAARIRQEDRLLASRFGIEFEKYRRRVGTLLPRMG
jgi:protein-S-isoprenylcysteine O-methyltransferase Ste14